MKFKLITYDITEGIYQFKIEQCSVKKKKKHIFIYNFYV